jgi:P4 family phage/plasmid primase-like protien
MITKNQESLLREIDNYVRAKKALFPLKPKEKRPLEAGWRTRIYTPKQLKDYVIQSNGNIAWRPGPLDLVIDVDPRKQGARESEEKLREELRLPDLSDQFPTICTGGVDKGRHYYARLPKRVKLRKKLEREYPGIDFISYGGYVAIAGCTHPETKRQYFSDPFSIPLTETPEIPLWLVAKLAKEQIPLPPLPNDLDTSNQIDAPPLTNEQIKVYLGRIDPTKHQDYPDWLAIGMACHNASRGDLGARELWVDWSTSDPQYFDADQVCRAKWASFSEDPSLVITAATLVQASLAEGGKPHTETAEAEFSAVPIQEAPSTRPIEDFVTWLTLPKERPPLTKAIKLSQRYGLDHWDRLRRVIKVNYDATFTTIDRAVRKIERANREKRKVRQQQLAEQQQTDAAIVVADTALDLYFEKGKTLIHAKNQQFYYYLDTHWEPAPTNILKQKVLDASETLQSDTDNDLIYKTSAVMSAAREILEAKQATAKDVFRFESSPPAVINTRNKEIWISPNGQIEPKDHKPESYLLNCLDADYDPKATCPLMDRTLAGVFRDNQEPDEMIRHFWEFAGYVIQPSKNLPSWWLLYGNGQNGKTKMIETVVGLMGPTVLPRSISEFADTSRNNHALASLVGKLMMLDDDANTIKSLPESALKKLAESKSFEANPKGKDAYVFQSCATPVILVNNWPPIQDLSYGLRRKAFVVPFRRKFTSKEQILDINKTILKDETPGVLNRSLQGYQRLRKRGYFLEPKECLAAKEEWLRAANPLIEFARGHTRATGNGSFVAVTDVYREYQHWCLSAGGVQRPLAQHRFAVALEQLGYEVTMQNDKNSVLGIELLEAGEN